MNALLTALIFLASEVHGVRCCTQWGPVGLPPHLCERCQVRWSGPGPCWCCGGQGGEIA